MLNKIAFLWEKRYCTQDHMLMALSKFGCAGMIVDTLLATDFYVSRVPLVGSLIALFALMMVFLSFGILCMLVNLHDSINPRHWVLLSDAHSIILVTKPMDHYRPDPDEVSSLTAAGTIWCKKNCKGRWLFGDNQVHFSRKEDAVLFTMFKDNMDE